REWATTVRVEPGPEQCVAVGHASWSTARQSIVEHGKILAGAAASRPVVQKFKLPVHVVAVRDDIAVEIPRRPLVEIDEPAAEPARRLFAAKLDPIPRPTLVGAPEKSEVVDLVARRFVTGVKIETHALAADFRNSNPATRTVQ